jgi:hypothetical protein
MDEWAKSKESYYCTKKDYKYSSLIFYIIHLSTLYEAKRLCI